MRVFCHISAVCAVQAATKADGEPNPRKWRHRFLYYTPGVNTICASWTSEYIRPPPRYFEIPPRLLPPLHHSSPVSTPSNPMPTLMPTGPFGPRPRASTPAHFGILHHRAVRGYPHHPTVPVHATRPPFPTTPQTQLCSTLPRPVHARPRHLGEPCPPATGLHRRPTTRHLV